LQSPSPNKKRNQRYRPGTFIEDKKEEKKRNSLGWGLEGGDWGGIGFNNYTVEVYGGKVRKRRKESGEGERPPLAERGRNLNQSTNF